jgi:hypothetical protein
MRILAIKFKMILSKIDHDGRLGLGNFIDVVSKTANQNECLAELSTFMVAKNTQGWFYQLMESITQGVIFTLKKTINFLSQDTERSEPDKRISKKVDLHAT